MKSKRVLLVMLLVGSLALCLISGNVSTAAGSTRQSNIKSKGILVETDSSKEVIFDSADLRYLANQCDQLETMINGLSMKQNADIVYVYHHHTGSETSYGGCYTVGYHTHVGTSTSGGACYTGRHVHNGCENHTHTAKTGSCYKRVRIHSHTETCYTASGTRSCGCKNSQADDGYSEIKCHSCGHDKHSNDVGGCSIQVPNRKLTCTQNEWRYDLVCTKTEGYQCGNSPINTWDLTCNNLPINRWSLGCNRREGEIVSATISFAPSGN